MWGTGDQALARVRRVSRHWSTSPVLILVWFLRHLRLAVWNPHSSPARPVLVFPAYTVVPSCPLCAVRHSGFSSWCCARRVTIMCWTWLSLVCFPDPWWRIELCPSDTLYEVSASLRPGLWSDGSLGPAYFPVAAQLLWPAVLKLASHSSASLDIALLIRPGLHSTISPWISSESRDQGP